MDAVTGLFQPIGEQVGAALCGSVFKVEYTDCGQRRVYLRLYSGTLRLRDTLALAGREKLKITEMRLPSQGEIVRTDTAYQGEIVILPSDSVRLNDVFCLLYTSISGVCPNTFPFGWNTHLCDFQLFSPGQGHRIPQAQRSAV